MAGKKKVPDGFWLDFQNVKKEIEPIIAKIGDFPRQTYLAHIGKSSLSAAITEYHGGFNKVRAKMGFEPVSTPSEKLSDWKYVKREVNTLIKILNGRFPTQNDFRQAEKSGLQAAIQKYHGGINVVREKMGYEAITTPTEKLSDWNWLSREVRKIIRAYGRFPEQTYLIETGRSDVKHSIKKYHGGYRKVKTRLGFKPTNTLDKSESWSWIRTELQQIIEDNEGKFPSGTYLGEIGRFDLLGAIARHHGGIIAVGNRLGYHQTPRGSWKDVNYALKKSVEVMNSLKLEYFPSQSVLRANGYGSLDVAIDRYHGGIVAFREKLREHLHQPSQKDQTESLLEEWVLK